MKRHRGPQDHFFSRPASPEIELQSLNDWYGYGVLRGLGMETRPADDILRGAPTYAGKGPCHEQYLRGIEYGRDMLRLWPPVEVMT